jgi:ADP-ribosylglycohydrolase
MAHDPLSSYDLVHDELAQRRETGYDVDDVAKRFAETDPADSDSLAELYEALVAAPRLGTWTYEEPSGLAAILDVLPDAHSLAQISDEQVAERVLGGWLGRIAGCNLGKPVENGEHWTAAHLRDYLERAGAYPLRDYIPVLDPMPAGFEFRDNWPHTTRGRVHGSDRDDDIDYSILGLHVLERHGTALRPADVAHAWLTLLPYLQVYTAERAAYRNLLHGVPLSSVATVRNPYREWIGAQIRGDVFGWVNPGRPRSAAALAFHDASLSHVANGIYGEMWAAALVAAAFTAGTAREAVEESLEHVPPRSRLATALNDVLGLHSNGATWDEALSAIQQRYGHYSWVHTINNAAVVAAALLWGDGDFAGTVGLAVQAGWDTDSNGATAGSVAGVLAGASTLPAHLIAPLDDRTRSALFGYDHSRISELARRTVRLAISGLD